jgi:hypothetical protein
MRLEPGEANDLVTSQGDDQQSAAAPEAVGLVAGVNSQGGLPVRAGLDEACLGDETERHLGQELGRALSTLPDGGQRRHRDPDVVRQQVHHGVDVMRGQGLSQAAGHPFLRGRAGPGRQRLG